MCLTNMPKEAWKLVPIFTELVKEAKWLISLSVF